MIANREYPVNFNQEKGTPNIKIFYEEYLIPYIQNDPGFSPLLNGIILTLTEMPEITGKDNIMVLHQDLDDSAQLFDQYIFTINYRFNEKVNSPITELTNRVERLHFLFNNKSNFEVKRFKNNVPTNQFLLVLFTDTILRPERIGEETQVDLKKDLKNRILFQSTYNMAVDKNCQFWID
jgi:hypothetical protein